MMVKEQRIVFGVEDLRKVGVRHLQLHRLPQSAEIKIEP